MDEHDKMMEGLLNGMQQARAMMAEATREPRYEYRIVPWEQVNPLAAAGWELRAAHIELTAFVMARKLGAADEAAALLAQVSNAVTSSLEFAATADPTTFTPEEPSP